MVKAQKWIADRYRVERTADVGEKAGSFVKRQAELMWPGTSDDGCGAVTDDHVGLGGSMDAGRGEFGSLGT